MPIVDWEEWRIKKLKSLARASWGRDASNLVKVTPAEPKDRQLISGYVGLEKFVAGRTPRQIEKILGLPEGYLRNGAKIYRLVRTPNLGEFELKGYSQCPDGQPYTGGEWPPGLGAPQWKLTKPIGAPLLVTLAYDEVYRP